MVPGDAAVGVVAITASRLADAFVLAVVGALAVTTTGAIIGFFKRLARLDRTVADLAERVGQLERKGDTDGGA